MRLGQKRREVSRRGGGSGWVSLLAVIGGLLLLMDVLGPPRRLQDAGWSLLLLAALVAIGWWIRDLSREVATLTAELEEAEVELNRHGRVWSSTERCWVDARYVDEG